jgi:hypothetical protein
LHVCIYRGIWLFIFRPVCCWMPRFEKATAGYCIIGRDPGRVPSFVPFVPSTCPCVIYLRSRWRKSASARCNAAESSLKNNVHASL